MSLLAPPSFLVSATAGDATGVAPARTTTQVAVPADFATSPVPASRRASAASTVIRPRTACARRPCATLSDTMTCTCACRASIATPSAADGAGMSNCATCAAAGVAITIATLAPPRNPIFRILPPMSGRKAPSPARTIGDVFSLSLDDDSVRFDPRPGIKAQRRDAGEALWVVVAEGTVQRLARQHGVEHDDRAAVIAVDRGNGAGE